MLMSEVWESYKSDKQLEGYSPHTIKSYELQCNLFIKYQGDADIRSISYEDMRTYLAKDAGRLKPSSIAFRMKFFRSLWRYAIYEGIVSENPASRLRDPKMPERVPKAMSAEEIEMLRIACKIPLENALLEVFFASGCRIDEIYKANRNIIDWENKSMTIVGKGNKERQVYFDVRCAVWLKKYLNARNDNDVALFVTDRKYKANGGQPRRMSKDGMRWTFKRIARRAGIEEIYPHKLRHSFAMHMLRNGAPLEVIQTFLGHSKLDTTRIYANHNDEMKRQLHTKYF